FVRPSADCLDSASMHPGELLRQRKADAETALGDLARRIRLREHREDMVDLLRRDTDARIGHAYHRIVAFAGERYIDSPARRRVLRSVIDQICDDLRQPDDV